MSALGHKQTFAAQKACALYRQKRTLGDAFTCPLSANSRHGIGNAFGRKEAANRRGDCRTRFLRQFFTR